MKKYQALVVILLMLSGLVSCGKKDGSFSTRPLLKYVSITPDSLTDPDSVMITCSFKDKEGDVQNKIWYQVISSIHKDTGVFASYQMPVFPAQKDLEGEIRVILYPSIDGFSVSGGRDSFYFRLYLQDMEGHISDTVQTDTVLVYTP